MFPYTRPKKPVIFGIQGYEMSPQERDFFLSYPPLGFILFARNLASPSQVRDLTQSLKEVAGEKTVPILIDEEGGQVSRLRVMSREYETALVSSLEVPEKVRSHYVHISRWLASLGITVNCAPVLDVRTPETASFLADRCLSSTPLEVALLGQAAIGAMQSEGITPVIKHMPGHGFAKQDSHKVLPVIEESLENLAPHFIPFQRCAALGTWGMTSHLLFPALDPDHLVTFSVSILSHVIRHTLGFQGFLITDDLYMGALEGFSLRDRIALALEAGHECTLVCHGGPPEWEPAVRDLPCLSQSTLERFKAI